MQKKKEADAVQPLGLYIHIPFCRAKCIYCDFYSLPRSEESMDAYVGALCRDLVRRADAAKGCSVDTVYFGGGTPSYLGADRLCKILETVFACYHVEKTAEITTEANPDSAREATALRQLRSAGFNRISLGMQSADDEELRRIGRVHTHEETIEAVHAARAAGFDNLSLDLIYGLPEQSAARWRENLRAALALAPEHLSCYGLKVEEGTPLFLFNVTIQNHGAYTVEDYPAEVTVEDAPGAYPKAEQYLTLANKTDEAFRQLVEYFEQQTEPTIIVMFGDHQPSVEQEFLDMAYGVSEDGMTMEQYMDKFKVPFVIWANYPLTGEKPGITSLNFLAQYVLRDAGIQTSAFGSYLWNLTKTIPAMTFAGYFDSEGNAYSHLETTEMTDLIRQYQTVQYNELFGGTDRQSSLFAAPVS